MAHARRSYTQDRAPPVTPLPKTWIVLLLLALGVSGELCADVAEIPPYPQGQYLLRNYGSAEGLANTSVLHMLQDRSGLIWVGTDDGLYRYDGYRFDGYGLDQGLASTAIDALHEDQAGTLWVGTRAGLSRWTGTAFEPRNAAHGLPEGAIVAIAHQADTIWAATTSGPYVAGADERFQLVVGWPGGEATALCAGESSVWVAQWRAEALIWRWRDGVWLSYASPVVEQQERIDAIVEDANGRVFVRTARNLWVLEPGATQFERMETPRPLIAQRGYLTLGRHGDLWVPTDDAGLLNWDGTKWTVGLRGLLTSTRAILEDAEGSLWFSSVGLNRVLGRGVFHAYGSAQGLTGNVPWVIFRDRRKNLWVGTNQGLARQVGARFEIMPGTEAHTIRSIVEAPDGTFYMSGVPADDLLHFDPETQAVTIQQIAPDNPAKRIYRLLLDPQGMLWAGTEGAGLLQASIRTARLKFAKVVLPGGTPTEGVSDLHRDQTGRFWVAGQRGLALLEAGTWRRFTTLDGLRSDSIAYVRTSANGDLLIVYFEPLGFTRARYEQGQLRVIEHYNNASHGIANKIFVIGEDSRQRIWIGGGRGVDLLGPNGTEHFGNNDGLMGEDTAGMAFYAEENGDVWIGAVGGLVRFDAEKYDALPPRTAPKTAVLSVSLGRQRFPADAIGTEVTRADHSFAARYAGMSFLGEGAMRYRVRLHGLEPEFTISDSREARYAALPPGDYRFEAAAQVGTHGAWGPSSNFAFVVRPTWWQSWWLRTIIALLASLLLLLGVRWRFAALHAQNLLLETHVASRTVELSDANRALQHANSSLQGQIEDRSVAELAVQQRNAELQMLNEKLAGAQSQLLQSEKMASVGQLAAGVAHEINNPVGYVYSNFSSLSRYMQSIFSLLQAYQLLEKELPPEHPEVRKMAALKAAIDFDYLVNDTANLLTESREGLERIQKIVKDLKDFSYVDAPEWQLADIHQSLDSTLNVIAHELKYKVELVKEYGTLPKIRCLPFQLNQVFLNLLINASHSIKEHGRITIQTGCSNEQVWVRISDTGQGISEANLKRIFDPFFTTKPIGVGTGLGLSVSWGIVQTHGGSIDVQSELDRGTVFTVLLPIEPPAQAIAS